MDPLEELKLQLESSEDPNPETDYVIEVVGGIHQKFTVTPLRQDFYNWDQAILAIAEAMEEEDVWLLASGNFTKVDMVYELRRMIGDEQTRQGGSEGDPPDEG